jgi:N-acetylglucosaminyldiphosphoundecaprenol N-acetyl-beta-D-mannosaminyltransferase
MNKNSVIILGSRVDVFDSYESVYSAMKNYLLNSLKPQFITINNVHTIVEGARNKNFREMINSSLFSIPDGRPLSIIQKIKTGEGTRIFGPTLFEKTICWNVKSEYKHFFFGSDAETLNRLKQKIYKNYSGVKVAGLFAPPFRDFTPEENKNYLKIINDSEPDFIWVALGAPKQEKWIYENYLNLNKGLMIGVGAGFDYFTGKLKHAPSWMKNISLEWSFRLFQEPKRLWKRYFLANSLFFYFYLLKILRIKKF